MATTKKPAKKSKFTLFVTMNGETYEVKGNDLHEMLQALTPPPAIKTDMVLVASDGKKTAEIVVAIRDARRTFHNRTKMELTAINLTKRLNG